MTTLARPTALMELDDNPWQPRASLDPAHIEELAADIKQNGLLQRPLVRYLGNERYQIAFGHYRIAALRLLASQGHWAGALADVVDIRNLSDREMAQFALSENSRRKALTSIEEYRAWAHAVDTIDGLTIADLAKSVGLDRSTVSNNLRLLRLPAVVLDRVDSGELSAHAAREFLCLVGPDGHRHDDAMAWVVQDIAKTPPGSAPDWRVDNVRRLIGHYIEERPVSEWRRLGPSYLRGEDPMFDVEAFTAAHPNDIHAIPRGVHGDPGGNGGSSLAFTCATRAWVTAQAAAKTEKEKAEASDGGDKPKEPPKATANFTKTLAADPIAAALTRPEGVSPETDTRKAPTLSKAVEQMTADQKAALGTRAEPVRLGRANPRFNADLVGGAAYTDRHAPPSYLDVTECLERCTTGATYCNWGPNDALHIYCLNEECYTQRVAEALEAKKAELANKLKEEDLQDRALAKQLASRLDLAAFGALATYFLASVGNDGAHRLVSLENLKHDERGELSLARFVTMRLEDILGVEIRKHLWGDDLKKRWAKINQTLAKATPELRAEVAALALVYGIRDTLQNGVPATIAALRGATTD